MSDKVNQIKLKLSEKLSYASCGAGTIIYFMIVGTYLLYIYTDMLKIPPLIAANIFLFTRIWDAIMDPIMGTICDKRPFKNKTDIYRPWILYCAFPLALFFSLCFYMPSFIVSDIGKVIFCVIVNCLYTFAQTTVQVPYGALANVMTNDTQERGSLGAYRNLGENVANLIVSATMLPMVALYSHGKNTFEGYTGAAVTLAVLATVFILISYKGVKERTSTRGTPLNYKSAMKMLGCNRPAICMIFALFTAAVLINFRFAFIMYYGLYYLKGSMALITLLTSIQTGVAIASFWLLNHMLKIYEKRTMFIITAVGFIIDGVIFLIASTNLTMVIIGTGLFGFLMACSFSTIWGTIPDCTEYGEWKTGINAPAFILAIITFAQKCGIGVASFLGAMALGFMGYVAGTELTPSTLSGIYWCNGGILIIGGILFAITIIPYNITKKKYYEITKELKKRSS
jgi:glycoside/pentoside/hexuronide:cation symporter, GPH family